MTTWTTNQGEELQISELSSEHIANIVLYLFRNAERLQRREQRRYENAVWSAYAGTQGEAALDAIDSEISACPRWKPLPREDWVTSLPIYEMLIDEAKKRRFR